jgi:hypothetical protein
MKTDLQRAGEKIENFGDVVDLFKVRTYSYARFDWGGRKAAMT